MVERVGLVGFELEEGITTVFNYQRDALRFAMAGVASNGGTVQRGGGVEPMGVPPSCSLKQRVSTRLRTYLPKTDSASATKNSAKNVLP